jgi:hypothetical protein
MSDRTSTLQEIRETFPNEYTTTVTMAAWIQTAMASLHTRDMSTVCGDVLQEVRRTNRDAMTVIDMMEFRTGEEVWMSTAWDAKSALIRDGVMVQNADGDPWALVGQVGRLITATRACKVCHLELSRAGNCVNCF